MKRSALLRRTPLRRSNAKRRAKVYARNYGERGQAVRDMPCILAGHVRLVVVEHIKEGRTHAHDASAESLAAIVAGLVGVDQVDAQALAEQLLARGRYDLGASAPPWGPDSLTLRRESCVGRIQAAHARARGMGGANGDRRDLYPACAFHHDAQGRLGLRRFAEIFGVDPISEAARIAGELDERGIP